MNNLRLFREARGMTQRQLAGFCSGVDSRIDSSMISRFECGSCLPTPVVAKALASALSCDVRTLFGGVEQLCISGMEAAEAQIEPLTLEEEELLGELMQGECSRSYLCSATDMGDRKVRRLIQSLREKGYCIVNTDGYYSLRYGAEDYERYRKTEYSRAMSILHTLRLLGKRLKEVGYEEVR